MNTPMIDCSKVVVLQTENKGAGAFANQDLKKGEIVEYGLMRIINADGHNNPYLFTWSDDRTIWAFASGCATFYNTSRKPNVRLTRNYEQNTFSITALMDITKGDELLHTYKSLEWRECFSELNELI